MSNSMSRQLLLSVLGVALLLIAVVGISYAIFSATIKGNTKNSISTDTISISYTGTTDNIFVSTNNSFNDANVYEFSVNSNVLGNSAINYEIVSELVGISDDLKKYVNFYLQREEKGQFVDVTSTPLSFENNLQTSDIQQSSDGILLYKGTLVNTSDFKRNVVDKFKMKVWFSDDLVISDVRYEARIKLNVYGKVIS